MKTENMLLLGGLALGGYYLYTKSKQPTQPVLPNIVNIPTPTQVLYPGGLNIYNLPYLSPTSELYKLLNPNAKIGGVIANLTPPPTTTTTNPNVQGVIERLTQTTTIGAGAGATTGINTGMVSIAGMNIPTNIFTPQVQTNNEVSIIAATSTVSDPRLSAWIAKYMKTHPNLKAQNWSLKPINNHGGMGVFADVYGRRSTKVYTTASKYHMEMITSWKNQRLGVL